MGFEMRNRIRRIEEAIQRRHDPLVAAARRLPAWESGEQRPERPSDDDEVGQRLWDQLSAMDWGTGGLTAEETAANAAAAKPEA